MKKSFENNSDPEIIDTEVIDPEIIDPAFSRKIYLIIISASFVWLLLIFLAPILSTTGDTGEKISSVLYLFFSKVCHQQDDRSFHIFEQKLGVCSRCVWLYAGFMFGTLIYPIIKNTGNVKPPHLLFLIIPVFFLFADVLLDTTGLYSNTFFSRSVTGFLTGTVLVFFLIPGFMKFFYEVHLYLKNKLSA